MWVGESVEAEPCRVPRERLTLLEAAVLAGVDDKERAIRRDIETEVMPSNHVVRLAPSRRLMFGWPHVYAFAAAYGNDDSASATLRKSTLEKVYVHAAHTLTCHTLTCSSVTAAWTARCGASRATVDAECNSLEIDRYLSVNLDKICRDVAPRISIYRFGLGRVSENADILNGDATFDGTRLSVRHIGEIADRGEVIAAILEDYPEITAEDVRFAQLYFRAHRGVGRPRGKLGSDAHVELDA